MITYKVVLDQRRPKTDGTCPLLFRITFNRTTTNYSSGIAVFKEHWSIEGSVINKSCPNYKELNRNLTSKYLRLQKLILELEDENIFSFENLKDKLNEKPKEPIKTMTFLNFAEKLINDMLELKRTGNAIVYRTGVNRLINYCGNKNLKFDQIDYTLLDKFKHHLIKDGVKPNTVGNYFRSIRAIYNKAIKAKLVDRSLYPFLDIKIKTEKTAKRAISIEDLKKVYNANYKSSSAKWRARNYFILSLSLRGISFTDMAYLTLENIQEGRLVYKRRKTHASLSLKLEDLSKDIFKNYEARANKYLIPVLPADVIEDSLHAKKLLYQWIKTTNKWLREIAKDCKISADITTYVTRHTWATLAKKRVTQMS